MVLGYRGHTIINHDMLHIAVNIASEWVVGQEIPYESNQRIGEPEEVIRESSARTSAAGCTGQQIIGEGEERASHAALWDVHGRPSWSNTQVRDLPERALIAFDERLETETTPKHATVECKACCSHLCRKQRQPRRAKDRQGGCRQMAENSPPTHTTQPSH